MRVPDLISASQSDTNAAPQHSRQRNGNRNSSPAASASTSPSPEAERPPATRPPPTKRKRITEPDAGRSYTRRKRAATACGFCRLRKTKCDNVRPVCGFCKHHGATCVYGDEEVDEAGNPTNQNRGEDASAVILERLDEIKQLLQSSPKTSGDAAAHSAYHREPTLPAGAGPSPGNNVFEDNPGQADRWNTSRTLYSALRCESMLRWPVFDGMIPEEDARIESFILEFGTDLNDEPRHEGGTSNVSLATAGSGVREDAFVPLCQRFLMHVHPRNPILEGKELMSYARRAAEHGVGWDSPSCLVLLTCALACLTTPWIPPASGTPFMATVVSEDVAELPLPAIIETEDCGVADAYYLAASKRIGLLGPSILDIQCLFLASMYEKCRLRPLRACFYIQQASTRLQTHLLRRGRRPWREANGREKPTQPLEQRVFWSCFKAENEILPTLGLRSSGLEDFTYPDSFPAPPSTLSSARYDNADYAWSPMSDDQQRVEEERSWLYYLAEISLRRTIKDTMAVLYCKGETYWLQNERLLVRQYDEFEKEISELHSHLPPLIQFDEHRLADNELSFYLQGRFQGWRESTLRPLLYCALHTPAVPEQLDPRVVELAQKAVDTCSVMVVKTAYHHRHGGSWFVARRAFSCALMILAARLKNGPVKAPSNWRSLVRLALRVMRRWGREARDIDKMRSTLERLFVRVQASAEP
ncbi:hypothetical protein CkaCkLH20_07446 [Colletotrichum karsti]|uniref:Zn(2)-C6 fungal-type domain-containing protein n=1 Tax=Colletotrichum karsti TaxID=1095194 RepID=A0A9P6I3J0_9PEZI|nr:uncharacterized protein CkaCkLH20_07446 [Colletotrichum karsti]KAF9875180.1 hypothetical protein CkaCkLH20_07446 [Colletotrichum karsti]